MIDKAKSFLEKVGTVIFILPGLPQIALYEWLTGKRLSLSATCSRSIALSMVLYVLILGTICLVQPSARPALAAVAFWLVGYYVWWSRTV